MIISLRTLLLFAICSFTIQSGAFGQLAPRIMKSEKAEFSHQYSLLGDDHYYFIDTSFNSLHWYHQFNHANRDLFGFARLGNMGAPLNPLTGQRFSNLWNYMNLGAMDPYLKRTEDIPLYKVRSPLTEATYWMGYERGQSFNLYHTQNINENWNFLINYRSLNATGDYLRNYNKHFNFLANTHYKNEDWGYEVYAHFVSDKMTNQENGGISQDSVFEENTATAKPRTLLAVNLALDSRTSINREVFLHQDLDLVKLLSRKDTSPEADNSNYFKVGHEFRYTRKAMMYRGNGITDFYEDYFFTEGDYTDSISYRSFENTAFIKTGLGRSTRVDLKAGIKNLTTSYGNAYFLLASSSWGVVGNLTARFSERLRLSADLDYIFIGDLDQSIDVGASLDLMILNDLYLFGEADFQVINPNFYQQTYLSNNFIWLNDFDTEVNTSFLAGLRWFKSNYLKLSNTTYDRKVFFNSSGMPEQSNELVNLVKVELNQEFTIWSFLRQENTLIFQRSDNQSVLPLPDYVGRHSLYFIYELFNGALKCQTGAELNYFTAYNSPSYNPATGVFYNANEKSIGDYPLVDFFANFKLRKTIFFIKLEHINEGLAAYNYYAAPNYPLADRSFRLGISWRFFN